MGINVGKDESAGGESGADAFVTVGTYLDITLAHLVRGCLEAAGVEAWVADESATFGNEGWVLVAQSVRVNVPADQADEALRILRNVDAVKDQDREYPGRTCRTSPTRRGILVSRHAA